MANWGESAATVGELVRNGSVVAGPGDQAIGMHLIEQTIDVRDVRQARGDVTHAHGNTLWGEDLHNRGSPPARCDAQRLFDTLRVD
ncbi:hypothetical protein ADL29_17775 [Streptomyces chattanoogensis]|uniref:Uncharacterized protein n=1 Tax=Streptomyces chattanoogensis TaxID=66876 RepID=A0A0N0XV28_9ACTN|nr:hypothetical protein [Streptomyces chattanoogensis]KPC62613.1 hypothetical protein ADL29_17775 [Streptomyces chattanoogensis]